MFSQKKIVSLFKFFLFFLFKLLEKTDSFHEMSQFSLKIFNGTVYNDNIFSMIFVSRDVSFSLNNIVRKYVASEKNGGKYCKLSTWGDCSLTHVRNKLHG